MTLMASCHPLSLAASAEPVSLKAGTELGYTVCCSYGAAQAGLLSVDWMQRALRLVVVCSVDLLLVLPSLPVSGSSWSAAGCLVCHLCGTSQADPQGRALHWPDR